MEAKLQKQQILSESIRKILSNFKKDSAKRKTAAYISERLEVVEELWTQFDLNNTILSTSTERKTDDYFINKAYEKVKQEYETIRGLLQNWQVSSTEDKGIPSNTDELINQQSTNFRAFMRIIKNINISDIKEKWEIEDKLEMLQARWKIIDKLHWQIDNLLVGTNVSYEEEYTKHETLFEATKRELNTALNISKHRYQTVPQIEIPTFSGSYAQWPTFMDLFSEAIHNNSLLTRGQKMQHLKGKLRGEAERLVQHLNVSAENYDTCWDILTHRYNNIQLLFSKQIQIFMNQPTVQQQTAFEIKRVHDTSLETIHAINNLGVNTTTWDPILVHILTGKLDPETYASYMESRKTPRELPSFDELIGFLETKFTALEPIKRNKNFAHKQNSAPVKEFTSKHISTSGRFKLPSKSCIAQAERSCPICKTRHILAYCKVFRNMTSGIKLKTLKQLQICTNCMFSHNGQECTSNKTCKICNDRHHTILHEVIDTEISRSETNSATTANKQPTTSDSLPRNVNHVAGTHSEVLLATVQLKIMAVDGTYLIMRCLLDQGSQISLITESAAQRLGLPRRKQQATVLGVGISSNESHGTIQLICESLYSDYRLTIEALVMKKVLNRLPNYSFEQQNWPHLRNITLADPDYNISRPIDILLDASVYAEIVQDGILRGPPHAPIAQQTQMGWVLMGNVTTFNCHAVLNNLEEISLFWESEEISESQPSSPMTAQEEYCEKLYQNTTRRLSDGRYEVRIPMKKQFANKLGASKPQAIAQFRQLEKRLANNVTLANGYKSFIDEYMTLGHMKLCKQSSDPSCYLPHHGVFKLDSTTTKLRVVFNASAKTKSGYSLNELMECGPNLQQDLQAMILRWRTYQFVYTADIEKFYRQIRIHEEDQRLQKIIWREESNTALNEYQLCTITYGTKSAPFLAMRTIKQLVQDDGHKYPLAAKALSQHLYVDDILGGSNHLSEARISQDQLIQMLRGGGFNLRKWASNTPALLDTLPQHLISQNMLDLKQAETNKALGIKWNPRSDQFTFNKVIDTDNKDDVITKRLLLSDLSKLYDPLGWLSPVTIKAKIIFQQAWSSGVNWDQPLPDSIREEWRVFRKNLPCLQSITIPRWLGNTDKPIELHGFSDASEKAYGCVIYCKSTNDNDLPSITLVAGKTKLVSLKHPWTLPRKELCASLLLSKLMKKVIECINVQTVSIHAWSDSMVVLGWLNGDANRWKTFVANRVKAITETIPYSCWNYVKSAENPADCASRGISPSRLPTHSLWWEGPTWLKTRKNIPQSKQFITQEEMRKQKYACFTQNNESLILELLQRHSSVARVIRTLSWTLRFVNNIRNKAQKTQKHYLLSTELESAHNALIKTVQDVCFSDDISRLKNNKPLRSTSNILSLNPILDEGGILKVGGRLTHSNLSDRRKHPIILASSHRLTELLIDQAHKQTLHGGARLTLAHLRNRYWVIGGMRTVKKQLVRCVTCHRFKQNKSSQLMADLPKPRVTPSRPFTHTGVDFSGRVEVKANKGRGIKTTVGYIAIFICLSTKAIHLELVSDLSSTTFLAALKRLCSRRGTPSHMYSDNGTNFVGAARILAKEYRDALQQYSCNETLDSISGMGISWHFNVPGWPSGGGVWEAAVKSMKHHLKRVLGEQKLTFEEFSTLLSQIEACLNSRPLIAITDDVDDIDCLTPGHFLIGGPLLAPPLSVQEDNIGLATRWQMTTKMLRDFWKRWSSDYLQTLQTRGKWQLTTKNIEKGDIVLLKEDNVPPGRWILGRVTETHPGVDGRVRVVTLKTKTNALKRPVTKLSLLPLDKNKQVRAPNSSDPGEPKQTRRTRKKSIFEYLCIFLTLIAMCSTSSVERFCSITALDPAKLVYFDKIADMHVSQDKWTMVVYYNMSSYWQSINNVEQYVRYLKGICNEDIADVTIATQFQHEIDELKHYNDILRSDHGIRTKRGLIDGVGYAANYLFGVLDERFAKQYKRDIKYLQSNDDHLLKLYKQHTSIIEGEYNMLKRNEEVMNQQFSAISQHLQQIDNRAKSAHERLLHLTTSALAANMIIASLHRIQQVLLDLVTDVRNGRLDTHLLHPDEFQQQLNIISRQIPNDLSVPCISDHSCIQQMYKLSHVHMRFIEDLLIFEVKLPLISNEQYELNRILPIPQKRNQSATRIVPSSSYLAVNLKRDILLPLTYNDLTSCEHINKYQLICVLTSPTYNIKDTSSRCEAQIINNKGVSSCKTVSTDCYDEWIKLTSRDAWLFSCCEERLVHVFCPTGITSQTLRNTGIITLSESCTLKGDEIFIHAHRNLQNTVNINRDTQYIPESGINQIINTSVFTFEPENHLQQLSYLKEKLEVVKNQQEALKERAETHDKHHYAVYAILALGGTILGACCILKFKVRFISNRQSSVEPEGNPGSTADLKERTAGRSEHASVDRESSPFTSRRN